MARKKRHWFSFLLLLVAVYAVLGFFVLPGWVKTQLEKRLRLETGRTVTIGRVQLNPFALAASIERVDVRTADGGGSLLRWNRLVINFDAIGSFSKDWLLSEVRLDGLQTDVDVAPDGTLNFADIIERVERRHPPAAVPRRSRPWRIGRLDVVQARVNFIDRSRAEIFQSVVGPANFTVLQFRTAGGQGAPLRLDATTESGEKITWLGTLRMKPFTSSGELRLENVNLPKYAPYLESRFNALVASGQFSISARYDLSLYPEDRHFRFTDGAMQLKQVRFTEPAGGEPIVDLRMGEVADFSADIMQRRVQIRSVQLHGGSVVARRRGDGTVNLLSLVKERASAPAVPAASSKQSALDLRVHEFVARDFTVAWDDLAGPRPIHFETTGVEATVKDITAAEGTAFPVDLSFAWKPEGTVHASGDVTLRPLRANLDLDVAAFALPPLGAYLERQFTARVARGRASAKGHVTLVKPEGEELNVAFTADGNIEDVAVTDANAADLAGFTSLSFTAARYDQTPRVALALGDIKLVKPYARAVINHDQGLNFSHLRVPAVRAPLVSVEAAPPKLDEGPAADVAIGRASIEGGEFTVSDQSVQPAVNVSVQQFGGTLRDLSARNPAGGEVDLHAAVNGAPVKITGRLSPFQKNPLAVLKVDAKGMDLVALSPYIGKFAGFKLERGSLSLDNSTKLIEQQLTMENTLRLEQITLGEPTGSADAVKLPVRLGVALLKDSEGNIKLDVPVQGSLRDPQFKVTNVFGQVISNVITKAVTSPFALIGSMFGGGGDELAQQEFAAGETTLTPESLRRLQTVQRALLARTEIRLDIEGGYDVAADTYALKRLRFAEQLKQRVWDERARITNSQDVTSEPITKLDREVMVRRIFDEVFPVLTRFSKPLPPAPPPGMEPEHPPQIQAPLPRRADDKERGFFERARDFATLKGIRDRRVERNKPVVAPKPLITERELPLSEMANRLAERISIAPEDLHALADARAARVKEMLTADGKIAAERVAIAKTSDDVAAAMGSRATLHLR